MDRFFLNPWALALGALATGIVLLYILRLRRKKVVISSTLLWERVVQDTRANAPWQKLRKNLLMFLQILALLLLALALARPFIFGTAKSGGRTALVVDASASMLATDVAPDRLGQALDAARKAVSDLGPNDEAMLVAASSTPNVLISFTKDKRSLLAALDEVRSKAGGVADLNAALKLVSSVTSGNRARTVIFSDGAVGNIDPLAAKDLRISFFPVGSGSDNLAIIGAGARRNPFSGTYDVFAAVRNFYPEPKTVDLVFSRGEDDIDLRTLEIQPGQREEVTLVSQSYSAEPIRIRLDEIRDGLKADDEAFVVMPPEQSFKVALCTAGESLLLRKVLESLKGIETYEYEDGALHGGSVDSTEAPRMNVWIVEGDAPAPVIPDASYLYINTSAHPYLPVITGPEVKLDFTADPPVIPMVIGMDRSHPILRFVSISDLKLKAMRRCQLEPWARSVVDGSEGVLIAEGDNNGQRSLYLAFDIYQSDFPLRAAFPIFMSNAIRYLSESGTLAVGRSIPAGERVDLLAPLEASTVRVEDPEGKQINLTLGGRDFTLGQTNHVGIYKLAYLSEEGEAVGSALVPVSLASEQESNITPASTLRVAGAEEALAAGGEEAVQEIRAQKDVRVNREFYIWLIALVLLIISLEWYLFHTRAM